MMTQDPKWGWSRNDPHPKVWKQRGKVAFAGYGVTVPDRRWEGKSFDDTLGAKCMQATKRACEDAGITLDQIDGVVDTGATGDSWAPRPFFAPPYDTEDGLTLVSYKWIIDQMKLRNVKWAASNRAMLGEKLGLGVQAVADGLCNTCLVLYTMGNVPGRYEQGGANAMDYIEGNLQWQIPWGYHSGSMLQSTMIFLQYCQKYGRSLDKALDGIASYVVNSHRNGLMVPWGFYTNNEPKPFTKEDYFASPYVAEPLKQVDCDRPMNGAAAFIITTAERAKDMKQKPLYVLDHMQWRYRGRSTMITLEEKQVMLDDMARRAREGSGLDISRDLDVFNPYDGYSFFTQYYLEAFQWHGVKKGEALDFYSGDIRVEGKNPFMSSGGNLGVGRVRYGQYTDCIEQLRGIAGPRQIKNRCEIAWASNTPPTYGGYIIMSKKPS